MDTRKHALPPRARDLTKESPFGRLTVIEYAGLTATGKHRRPLWRCRCECGKICIIRASSLVKGATTSCGCLHKEVILKAVTKHGHLIGGMPPEYRSWAKAKSRCHTKSDHSFAEYGARGICMCSRWRDSFAAFYEDMGTRPSAKHSIDRKNGDLGYWCGRCEECTRNGWIANCRWATPTQQSRNRAHVRKIAYKGQELLLPEWAEKLGIPYRTLYDRLKRGWSVDRALKK